MKKIIIAFFASVFLLGAASCADPYADELYDLQSSDTDGPGGEVSPDPEDNPPPSSSD